MTNARKAERANLRKLHARLASADVWNDEQAAHDLIIASADAAMATLGREGGLIPGHGRSDAFRLLALVEQKLNDLDAALDGIDAEAEFSG